MNSTNNNGESNIINQVETYPMTNDLKNFLEEEQQDVTHKMFNDVVDEIDDLTPFDFMGRIRDHDTRLINFVLDLVEKEVREIDYSNYIKMDVLAVINNLRP